MKGTYLDVYSLRVNQQCEFTITKNSSHRWDVRICTQECGDRFGKIREHKLVEFEHLDTAMDYVDRFCRSFLELPYESDRIVDIRWNDYKLNRQNYEDIVKMGGMA